MIYCDETSPRTVEIYDVAQREVSFLKAFTWHFVIQNPAVAQKQHGQKRIIEELFNMFYSIVVENGSERELPWIYRDELKEISESGKSDDEQHDGKLRVIADMIASLTEQEAIDVHHRLCGTGSTSILLPVLR